MIRFRDSQSESLMQWFGKTNAKISLPRWKLKLSSTTPAIGGIFYLTIVFFLSAYFAFSAIQGNHGLFRRIQADAQAIELQKYLDVLENKVIIMENKTHRLSDNFLDLDLLDEQARKVLGMARPDEIIIN